MSAGSEVGFRLRLADGFLAEARQDLELERWRSCVDHSQLATENAAKAGLALIGPVGRTHTPSILLRRLMATLWARSAPEQNVWQSVPSCSAPIFTPAATMVMNTRAARLGSSLARKMRRMRSRSLVTLSRRHMP